MSIFVHASIDKDINNINQHQVCMCVQNVSEETLINDQQLFSSRRAYERQAAATRAAEADTRSAAPSAA